jgi:transglutaminase-like putative cysteine protease
MSTRGELRTLVALTLGVVITTILAWAIPWLHAKMFDFFMKSLASSSSGLVGRIALEHDTNITLSDERVLRVRSSQKVQEKQPIDYLRGYVFSRYAYGEWQSTGLPGASVSPPRYSSERSFSVELASPDFLVLLPRDSRHVTIPAKSIRVDNLGVPVVDRPIESYSFELGIRDTFPISGPQREDSLVPAAVRSALEPVAQAWTTNVTGTKEQLDAISLAFHSNFRWSLQSLRSIPGDPVVDFVLRERVGHCEYFASAMALMARSIGIPARVVNGYRVVEYNQLDDSYVVRKSHAHAWIEAWVEGKGWLTYDPTPDTEDMVTHKLTLFESVLDLINARPKSASLAFLGIVGMIAAALSFRPRFFLKQKQVEGEPILIAVAALVRHIAERTRKRLPGEALLVWARQVATADELSVIERYSELRWGGLADAESIEREAERLLKKTTKRKKP